MVTTREQLCTVCTGMNQVVHGAIRDSAVCSCLGPAEGVYQGASNMAMFTPHLLMHLEACICISIHSLAATKLRF
jgi:hypothetical protein